MIADDLSLIDMEGLRFLAGDRDAAERFFAWSGLDAGSLRAAAGEPGFAEAIVAFLCQDEPLLLRFCRDTGHDPAALAGLGEALAAGNARAATRGSKP